MSIFYLKNEQDCGWGAECLPCQRSKCKDKYFLSKPPALCKSGRELPYFSNSNMSEAKEAIIREDNSEGDDTKELKRTKNEGDLKCFSNSCACDSFSSESNFRRRFALHG